MEPNQTMPPSPETEIINRLATVEAKVDEMTFIVRKMRLYSQLTFWFSAILIVGPLILLPFVIPLFLSSLTLPSDTGTTAQQSADITNLLSTLGM